MDDVYQKYTQAEIMANRRTWIDFLKSPKRKKIQGILDGKYGERCCLGHACAALKIPKAKIVDSTHGDIYAYKNWENDKIAFSEISSLPDWVADRLGMWTIDGDFHENEDTFKY